MLAVWSIPSFLLALGLEGYAIHLLLIADAGFAGVAALHALSSLFGTLGAACLLPKTYHEKWPNRLGFYLALMFCMPAFGLLGVLCFLLPSLFYPRPRREVLWKDIAVPELPFRPVHVSSRANYGEGGLASVIHSARDPERRVRAVIAARQINDKLAVPLLQEALKDPVDDVRLFAYSVLDSKETRINERITEQLADLEVTAEQDNARTHYALAQNYWEMAFLGLATGNTLDYVLDQAEKHATLAAESGWSGSDIEFLVGRIQLRRGKYDQAEKYFLASLQHGALESAILPFLSEIAFERRDFNVLRETLQWLDFSCDGHSPIPAVVQAWKLS